jgi:threonine aldolase
VMAADSVTFCLSKGLSAPVGSVLCGSKVFIQRAIRIRKQLGGGMRQAGVLAAAGIVALESMTERLSKDHLRAQSLVKALAAMPAIEVYPQFTNIVRFKLADEVEIPAEELVAKLSEKGVRIGNAGTWGMRAVTHYWIDDEAIKTTIEAFESVLNAI